MQNTEVSSDIAWFCVAISSSNQKRFLFSTFLPPAGARAEQESCEGERGTHFTTRRNSSVPQNVGRTTSTGRGGRPRFIETQARDGAPFGVCSFLISTVGRGVISCYPMCRVELAWVASLMGILTSKKIEKMPIAPDLKTRGIHALVAKDVRHGWP